MAAEGTQMIFMLVAFAATAALEYHTPQVRLDAYTFTAHPKGATLYAASADVALHAQMDVGAKVLASLPFGAALTIDTPGTRTRVKDRVDQWYAVHTSDGRAGFVFGAWLTPFRFDADFDQDGDEELATVAFSDDFAIAVRFYEARTKKTAELTFAAAGQGYLSRRGGNVEAELVPAKSAGLPLLQVSSRPEACSDYFISYVSYTKGRAQMALTAGGLIDPPNRSVVDVAFDPAKKQATLTRTNGEDGEERIVTKTLYGLKDGVFFVVPTK